MGGAIDHCGEWSDGTPCTHLILSQTLLRICHPSDSSYAPDYAYQETSQTANCPHLIRTIDTCKPSKKGVVKAIIMQTSP